VCGQGAVAPVVHVAAVVREKDKDGVVVQTQLLEPIQYAAESGVHGLNHGSHGGAFLPSVGAGFADIVCAQTLFAFERGVYVVEPQVQQERPIAVGLNKAASTVNEQVVDMGTGGSGRQVAVCAEGGKVTAGRTGVVASADDGIESLVFRNVGVASQMPFAHECGGVTGGFHNIRIGYVFVFQAGAGLRFA